ncbi:hypothetical protein VA7868_02452 [Vibrio aerogenes CECT 7868]|uniref:Uncharacterized protein n=2 Tax=Vibrio aerogenes TaxID=92172 RepID=A0A1M5Z965_9VIBR|nr:hypothetical protein [Vibrio aerogenes]SHI20754.1 hypothetical protein VA7868_02452 [Vibrio aerogenes CECT 7868]
MGWSFKDVIGLFSLQWVFHHLYIAAPILGTILLILVKTAPQRFLNMFGYKEIYEGGSNDNGPKIKEKHIRILEIEDNSDKYLNAKKSTERILATVYDQKTLSISGFNRALLIAFIYPMALFILTWVFSGEGLTFNEEKLLPNVFIYKKILFLIVCISFYILFHKWGLVLFFIERQLSRLILNKNLIKFIRFVISCCYLAFVVTVVSNISSNSYNSGVISVVGVVAGAALITLISSGTGFGAVIMATVIAAAGTVTGVVAFSTVVFGIVVGVITYNIMVRENRWIAIKLLSFILFFFIILLGLSWPYLAGLATKGTVIGFVAFSTIFSSVFVGFGIYHVMVRKVRTVRMVRANQQIVIKILSFTLFSLVVLCWFLLPYFTDLNANIESSELQVGSSNWISIFFLGSLPALNGLSDWLSVSFTQYCLSRYSSESNNWCIWLLLDFMVALLMLLLVFAGVFGILYIAQLSGWGVNAKDFFDAFKSAPFSQDNRWIVLLVVTNLLPTLVHFLLILFGHFSGWFFKVGKDFNQLAEKYELANSLTKNEKAERVEGEYTWTPEEAREVAEYLCGMRGVWCIFTATFIVPFLYGVYWLITEGLQRLVGVII